MTGVRDHTELHAWQLAEAVRTEVAALTARPEFQRHNARFLRIAKSSLSETIEHLASAERHGLITANKAKELTILAKRSRGACTQLIRDLETAKAPR